MPRPPNGCVFALLDWMFGRKDSSGGSGMPEVRVSDRFVTDAERNFFHVLRGVVGQRGYVLAQVSLQQILYLPGNLQTNPGRQRWTNKIAARSVDFLVCDVRSLRPLVAIELDDATHARPRRQTRDDEVESLLKAADLPLLRVLAGRTYNPRELATSLLPYLGNPVEV